MVLFLTDWTKKKSEFQQMQRNDVHIQIRTLEDTFMRHLDAFIALYQVESTTSTELCELQAKIRTIQIYIHTSGSSESRNTDQASLEVFQEQFCRISGHTPDAVYIINGKISYRGAIPVNQRTMFDVYKGELHGGEAVAIKHFRQWLKNDDLGRIMRQVQQWSSSSSPFILECRGIGIQTTPAAEGEYDKFQLYLVSPFMKRQDAVSYIRKLRKEGADVNILKYLQEAARGIEYLHHRNPSCVHAGVRGENIIIKDDDTACLNGFGITKVVAFTRLPEYMGFKYKYRWMAPELLAQDKSPMKPCDIWAWAMTALELITGQKPYYGVRKLTLINHIVTQGKRPELSDYPTFEQNCPQPDRLWALLERCWVDASDRPSIREVISELEDIERVQIEQQVAHEWAR
ncbi:unnamed protein product [Rhizoctonia solani]|uniref:Protein kinase domain-containing protein n=1 Tax=Rhizoctonia solani TaxID=456999 RepID=A0A8H3DY74_9AGAM|nr:unnamed protein product [Rhizoctonia solani]